MVPSAIPAIKTRPLFRFNGALPTELIPTYKTYLFDASLKRS